MSRTFLIDTDTASDDAVAILMALRDPEVEVAAVTVVSGNVPVDQGVRNALTTVELCGSQVPVYRGAERPLERPPTYAEFFHGADGMGDMNYPEPRRRSADGEAIDALVETVAANPGLVLVTLGPLTNIARAVLQAPELVDRVSRCVVMGGAACTVGNITPAAEFNLYVDPEAARIVFHSGLPIELVGWELCRGDANLDNEDIRRIRGFGTSYAEFCLDCNRRALEINRRLYDDPGIPLPDPVAMAVALEPQICTRRSDHWVEIETTSELTRGMTVVDALDITADEQLTATWGDLHRHGRRASVCWEIDVAAWKERLERALR
ncbi:MAG: nucleoside hydrolase [Thermoanaerobaculia bacterium]